MYYAHNYSRDSWAGEPEIDPTQDHEHDEDVRGWEVTPYECLDHAHRRVMREQLVEAGRFMPLLVVVPISPSFPLAGSSTACLLTLNSSSGVLRSAK